MQTDVCIRIINEKMNKFFLDHWVFGYTRDNCFWLQGRNSFCVGRQEKVILNLTDLQVYLLGGFFPFGGLKTHEANEKAAIF